MSAALNELSFDLTIDESDNPSVAVLKAHIDQQERLLREKSEEIARLTEMVKNLGRTFGQNTGGGLNDLVKSQNAEIARLKEKIRDLQNPQIPEDFVTYDEFMRKLSSAYGRLHRSRIEFIEQSGKTSFGRVATGTFNSWRLERLVPVAAYNAIDEMVFEPVVVNRAPTWTEDEYERLQTVLTRKTDAKAAGKKMNYHDIAVELTNMFGRKITEDAVKSAIRRLRQQTEQDASQRDADSAQFYETSGLI